MSMAEENIDSEELEGATVELEDEQVSGVEADLADDASETRTKVRRKSDGDDELENYSEGVKKRINQLTAKRKAASEEAEAAVQYAQQVHQENQQMKARLQQLDQGYRSEYEGRVVSQEQQAKRALTEAHEAGDYEKVAEAQSALSQVAIEKERIRLQTAKAQRDAQQREQQAQQQQQQQQYQQQQPQRQAADPKLEKWLSKNDWFEKDNVMKAAATAIHNQIVGDEGFDPSTDEYYAEIDKRIRKEMPHKFQAKQQNAQVVTATRSARDSESRENAERIQQWRPGSALDAPEPPIGFKHRWIRESVLEYDDKTNVHKKRQEGWELVRAEEYPDYVGPIVDEGRNAGTIGVGGLVLARIPNELVLQRNRHFQNVAKNQMDAVDRDWMRENNALMPKLAPQRKSSVSFGSKGSKQGD